MWDFYTRPPKLNFVLGRHKETAELAVKETRGNNQGEEQEALYSLQHFIEATLQMNRFVAEIKQELSRQPPGVLPEFPPGLWDLDDEWVFLDLEEPANGS